MSRFRQVLLAVIAAIGIAAMAAGGAAQASSPPTADVTVGHGVIAGPDGMFTLQGEVGPFSEYETLSLYVRVSGPSVLEVTRGMPGGFGSLSLAARHVLYDATAARQAPVEQSLASLGAVVVGRFRTTINALHVHVPRAELRSILEIPGVVAVSRAPVHVLLMDNARPHVGATRVEEELGWDGQGTTIAVIDTGVDYMHAGLGGHGDRELRAADDPTFVEDGTFPTEKVVGGYDFVGTRYNAGCGDLSVCTRTPEPDEDPIDENGHGSHVSGIAAGLEAGSVPKGVAPGATVVGLKVFGAGGSTDITAEAIDWVATHNVLLDDPESDEISGFRPATKIDVINMSLGASFGPGNAEYNDVMRGALDAGVTVVASAGNSGLIPYITGTPSASPYALSVANSWAPGETGMVVQASWTDDTGPRSVERVGFEGTGDWLESLSSYGAVEAGLAFYGLACGTEEPAQDVSEKIALIERGTCPFYDKLKNAVDRGAVGAVVFSDARQITPMGCGAPSPCDTSVGIPGVMIERMHGQELQSLITDDGLEVTVRLDPEAVGTIDSLADVMSGSSSRGPSRYLHAIKPQITAPGSNILSVGNRSGTGTANLSGTSMSGPVVAGVAALIWSRSYNEAIGIDALEVAALAMNYADPVIRRNSNVSGELEGVTSQGAGLVQAYESAVGGAVVRSDDGIAELSFGMRHFTDTAEPVVSTMTIRNLDEEAKFYALDYDFVYPDEDADRGISLSFEPELIELGAGETASVTATMSIEPADVREWVEYGNAPLAPETRYREYEIDGYVHFTQVDEEGAEIEGGDRIGVPFHTVPRKQACTVPGTEEEFELTLDSPEIELEWENECEATGLAAVALNLGVDDLESMDVEDFPAEIDAGAVGVRYGTIATPSGDVDLLIFFVTTAGRSTLVYDKSVQIVVDLDRDGTWDRWIGPRAVNAGDQYAAFYGNIDPETLTPTGTLNAAFLMNYDIDDSTQALAIPFNGLEPSLTLADGDVNFDFAVIVTDSTEDYPRTDSFLGEDHMPDGLLDGEHFSFDQAVLDCIEVTDAEGTSLIDPSTLIRFTKAYRLEATAEWTCDAVPDIAVDVGILTQLIYNLPGATGTTDPMIDGEPRGWSVRPGTVGERIYTIHMPYAVSDWPSAGEPDPDPTLPPVETPEPTEGPGEPTAEPTAEPEPTETP